MYLPSFTKKSFFCSQNLNEKLVFIYKLKERMMVHAADYLNLMINLLAEFSATLESMLLFMQSLSIS